MGNQEQRTVPCPKECGRDVTYGVFCYQGKEYPPTPPTCALCTSVAEAEAEHEAKAQQLAEVRKARGEREANVLQLLHDSGVNPWEHGRATLDAFDPTLSGDAPLLAARAFLDRTQEARGFDPVQGLNLIGPTGTGKTLLAVGIVREVLLDPRWNPKAVLFDHAASLITEIQDSYGSGDRSVMAVKRRRINAGLWVLDDLGTERASDDVARILTEILTLRAMRPTVLTSNYPPEELEGRNAELWRIGSRLGPAYFDTVVVEGTDRRHLTPQ